MKSAIQRFANAVVLLGYDSSGIARDRVVERFDEMKRILRQLLPEEPQLTVIASSAPYSRRERGRTLHSIPGPSKVSCHTTVLNELVRIPFAVCAKRSAISLSTLPCVESTSTLNFYFPILRNGPLITAHRRRKEIHPLCLKVFTT